MAIDTTIPGASVYLGRQAAAEKAYQAALAGLQQKRGNILQQYGFAGTVGADGSISDYHTDDSNQYGLVQQTKRAHELANKDFNTARDDYTRGQGFKSVLDASGKLQSYDVDNTNELGAFQQMLRGSAADMMGAKQNALERGLGHSGLANQRQGLIRDMTRMQTGGLRDAFTRSIGAYADQQGRMKYDQGLQDQNLGQDFLSQFQGLAGDQRNALLARDNEYTSSEQDAAQNASQYQMFQQSEADAVSRQQELIRAMQGLGGADNSPGADTIVPYAGRGPNGLAEWSIDPASWLAASQAVPGKAKQTATKMVRPTSYKAPAITLSKAMYGRRGGV